MSNLRKWMMLILIFSSFAYAKQDLAVCLIFQNEGPYLKEWLEFHKLQGVRHFYLYNNNSCDEFDKVLKPYIAAGQVTLIEWPYTYNFGGHQEWIKIQARAYTDCIQKFGAEWEWIAFIDADEFLFCPSGQPLYAFIKGYAQYPGVLVPWLEFGTSYVWEIPKDKLTIETLTRCIDVWDCWGYHKSIVQPDRVKEAYDAHMFTFLNNELAVNAARRPIKNMWYKPIDLESIRINHYWTRDEKYFNEKKIAGRVKRRSNKIIERMKKEAALCNKCEDFAIMPFVLPLRDAMGLE